MTTQVTANAHYWSSYENPEEAHARSYALVGLPQRLQHCPKRSDKDDNEQKSLETESYERHLDFRHLVCALFVASKSNFDDIDHSDSFEASFLVFAVPSEFKNKCNLIELKLPDGH